MPAEKEKLKGEYTGRWNARFTIKLINGNSKRIYKRGFKSKKEALEYEKNMILDNSLGSNIQFRKIVDKYLEYKKMRVKESSFLNLKSIFKNITFFDNFILSEITPKIISDFQNELIKTYKPSTVKIININLRMLFTWCVRYRNLSHNPFDMVERLKIETSKEINIITVDEFNQIVEQVNNEDMKLMFKLLFWTGLRIGEARALKIDDIDFENKTISVTKNYTKLHGKESLTSPKTKRSNRIIRIDDKLVEDIKEYLDKALYIIDDDFIFRHQKTSYTAKFKKVVLKVLKKDLRIHDLRHSHASFLINNGVDILLISQRLGHSNIAMTLNVYSHLYPSKENETIELINKLKGV